MIGQPRTISNLIHTVLIGAALIGSGFVAASHATAPKGPAVDTSAAAPHQAGSKHADDPAGAHSGSRPAHKRTTNKATKSGRKNVVELFTSQGCSSCPKADALFKHYATRPNIVALSFNVDYWDYLGWKDTLGQPAHTKRQRAYAAARRDGMVYTPQVITNGLTHVIGSSKPKIEHALNRSADTLAGRRPELVLENDATSFIIRVRGDTPPSEPATVYIAAVSPSVTVEIQRGENRGRQITYHNVVRSMIPVGMWSGTETTIRLRREDVMSAGGELCAVLVQAAHTGPVLAADWMPE